MQDEKPIDGADGEVERALISLSPLPSAINRDRLLFSAGYRSAQPKLWMWRGMTASLAALLLLSIFIRPQIQPNPAPKNLAIAPTRKSQPSSLPLERVANKWLDAIWPASNQSFQPIQPQNPLAIRQAVLERGISALPSVPNDATLDPQLDDPSIFNLTKRAGKAL